MGQRRMKDDVAYMIAPVIVQPIARWPFYAFLCGAMFCLLASSTCHLLSCHSRRLAYIMLRLDYAGIAALIATSFYPPVYYSFMCHPALCNLYLAMITVLGIATVAFSLLPVFQNPEYRTMRACLFLGMGLSGVIPVLHKLVLFWHQPEALHTTGWVFFFFSEVFFFLAYLNLFGIKGFVVVVVWKVHFSFIKGVY
jgi:adiponectin receptor